MSFEAIVFLIIGIFLIIFSILIFNHYRLHPKKGSNFLFFETFVIGIIVFLGALTDNLGLMWFLIIIITTVMWIYSRIYKRQFLNKNPEIKKKLEIQREIFKNHPVYKLMKILQYLVLAFATTLGVFVLVVVLFNMKF